MSMNRFIFTIAVAALLLPAMAQVVEVASLSRLLEGVEGPAFFPVLDQQGKRLLFLGENGALKLHDLVDGVTATVTQDYVYRTGHAYDMAQGKVANLTGPEHGPMRAVPATRGGALRAPGHDYKSGGDIGSAAWAEGSTLHVIVGGDERVFSPVNSWAGYLWASLSPDGKRVAFFAAGKGIVICGGGRIVYSTIDGLLYEMKINIHE